MDKDDLAVEILYQISLIEEEILKPTRDFFSQLKIKDLVRDISELVGKHLGEEKLWLCRICGFENKDSTCVCASCHESHYA